MKGGFRAFIDNKIKEYLSKYKDSDLKPEKKETIHVEKKNITNLDAIYQIPYPSFLKDDILLFYQVLINNREEYDQKINYWKDGSNYAPKYDLDRYNQDLECFVKKEKLIEIANKVYEDVQNYAKRLIETENYKIFYMDHYYFLNVCDTLKPVENFEFGGLGLNKDLIGLLYLVHRCGERREKSFESEKVYYDYGLSKREKYEIKKEIKDIILSKDGDKCTKLEEYLEKNEESMVMADALKEIGMKNLDEFLDKLEEKNEEKNEEKIEEKNEEKNEEKYVEKNEGKMRKKMKEKMKKKM